MMKNLTLAAFLAASFVSVSAHAVEATINVTAKVDPILSITAPGGVALVNTIKLQYDDKTGKLKPAKLPFQLVTNVDKNDFEFKINTVELVSGTNRIPLTLKVNNTTLSTTATTLPFTDAFIAFNLTSAGAPSKELSLEISTKDDKPVLAGDYTGDIKLEVTQKP